MLFEAGTVAIVTGGSRGIGSAAAKDLAREGAHVGITYVQDADAAQDNVNEIVKEGGSASSHQLDLADPNSIRQLFRTWRTEVGRLDVFVSNAGFHNDGFIAAMSDEKFASVIAVNLTGSFLSCREAFKIMAAQRRGSIVTVSSTSAFGGVIGQANYCAAKAGMVQFTRVLALEAAQYGVRANSVVPGYVMTDTIRRASPAQRAQFKEAIPVGRFGEPDEIARVISFVASDRASYMTGVPVVIDGGLTA